MRVISVAATLACTGCAGTFDLFRGETYVQDGEDSTATGLQVTQIEYDAAIDGPGRVSLTCTERTRALVRERRVTRTYRYRGSYEQSTYTATLVVDAVIVAVAGGALAGICASREDSSNSCYFSLLAVAPWLVDLPYAAVRRSQAEEPVLIDKSRGDDRIGVADTPLAEEPRGCESVAEIYLGELREVDPNSFAATSPMEPELATGAMRVERDELGTLLLAPAVIERMVERPGEELVVVDHEGKSRAIRLGQRCELLRANLGAVGGETLSALIEQCPPPEPSR